MGWQLHSTMQTENRMNETTRLALVAAAVIGSSAGTSAFAAATSYELDASHTWVVYEIVHFGTSTNRGRFPIKAGKVQIDVQGRTGQLDVTIDTSAPRLRRAGVGPDDARRAPVPLE